MAYKLARDQMDGGSQDASHNGSGTNFLTLDPDLDGRLQGGMVHLS